MSDLVTEDDLARARSDPEFRQQLLAKISNGCWKRSTTCASPDNNKPEAARQIREGVDLAVKLADRLQATTADRGPQAA